MRFAARSLSPADFDAWVKAARASDAGTLDRAAYLQLERPSENAPVRRFASVEAGLFDRVVNLCVEPGKMCMRDMMAIDMRGGAGLAGVHNVRPLTYDKFAARGLSPAPDRKMIAALCTPVTAEAQAVLAARPADLAPLTGLGLPRPGGFTPSPLIVAADVPPPTRPRS